MQYMGGKSRIARPIAEIINTALTVGGKFSNATGGLALLAFSVVAAPLKAKLLAMTALY